MLKRTKIPQSIDRPSIFGIGVDGPAIALVAFLEGKATPRASPRAIVLPKMLQAVC
jgi:hypothetical protein